MAKFWNYTHICAIHAVINYSFEASTSISGTCWLFSSAYDFMVSKIDLKPLKLKEDWIITYMYKVHKKGKSTSYQNWQLTHIYCDYYKDKQSLLDYIMPPSLKQEEIHLIMRSVL